jgi:hypothetical protein
MSPVTIRTLVVVGALTGCYRNDAPTTAPTVAAAPIIDAPEAPAGPVEQPATGDNRLYASLSKPERIAFCEQEKPGTHGVSLDDMRLGLCRLQALPDLVSRAATAAASRQRCQKSVDDCLAEPYKDEPCETDEEKECAGITVGDYRGCYYEMRKELRDAANEDLCATMDPFDRERAFSRRDAVREGAACTAVRQKCGLK